MTQFFKDGERISAAQFETKMRYQYGMVEGMEFDEVTLLMERLQRAENEDLRDIYLPDGIEITFDN